jgi:hypothetical protein
MKNEGGREAVRWYRYVAIDVCLLFYKDTDLHMCLATTGALDPCPVAAGIELLGLPFILSLS